MKRLVFFILFLSLLVSFGNEGWVRLYHLKQFGKSLEEKNGALAKNNRALFREIQDLKDSRYLEHYIREELGYLKENEVSYEFRREEGVQSP
jgi:cell division protein FtsB